VDETPVPLREIAKVGLDALLVRVKDPEAEPLAVGVRVTVICRVWLAVRVKGVVTLLVENPVPATRTAEMVMDADPELVIVTVFDWAVLMATFPKASVVALVASVATWVEPTPVPVRDTDRLGVVDALLVNVMVPFAVPVAVGAKMAV
jgi:hypothetical protein